MSASLNNTTNNIFMLSMPIAYMDSHWSMQVNRCARPLSCMGPPPPARRGGGGGLTHLFRRTPPSVWATGCQVPLRWSTPPSPPPQGGGEGDVDQRRPKGPNHPCKEKGNRRVQRAMTPGEKDIRRLKGQSLVARRAITGGEKGIQWWGFAKG